MIKIQHPLKYTVYGVYWNKVSEPQTAKYATHIFLEILNFVKVNIFVMDNSIQTKFKIMNLNNLFF